MASEAYTIKQVAKMLGINVKTAYDAARAGAIPCLRLGRRMVIPKAAFDRMLEQQSSPKSAAA